MFKRTWRAATAVLHGDSYALALDGIPKTTPAGNVYVCPTSALAEALVAEWNAAPQRFDPRAFPLSQLIATAHDIVATRRAAVISEVAAYAANDLLCLRAAEPPTLAQRQTAERARKKTHGTWHFANADGAGRDFGMDEGFITAIKHRCDPHASGELRDTHLEAAENVVLLAVPCDREDAALQTDCAKQAGFRLYPNGADGHALTVRDNILCGLPKTQDALVRKAVPAQFMVRLRGWVGWGMLDHRQSFPV